MFLRVKAWADLTREEKVSSRQQTPWQLQTATSLHSRLQPGGPQSSHQVRYDGAQVQRNPSTHCSPKGGQHRERRWVFDLAKVPAGTPAYDQILDEPPQLLLAKIFAFSANQTYIKKNYREFERNRKVALILSQQRGEHSRIIPQELCPPSPSPMRRISSVQSLSHVQIFATPWTAAHQASLSITNSWNLLKLMSIESVMPSNHFILCRPLLLPLQSFPASGYFLVSRFFASGGQSIGASASASVLLTNIQDRLTGLISLKSKGLSRVFSNTTVQSINSPALRFLYSPTLTSIHDYWKNHGFDWMKLCWQSNVSAFYLFIYLFIYLLSLLFNMLSRLVIAFLPRSKHLLISWLQSPPAVILEPPKIQSLIVSIVSPSICQEVMGQDTMILFFWVLSFKPAFWLSSFTFIKMLF